MASSARVCQGSPGCGTVSVSGGGFLTSGWEGSARNHEIWGRRLVSQLWEPEVFTQKRLFSLSCAVLTSLVPREGASVLLMHFS